VAEAVPRRTRPAGPVGVVGAASDPGPRRRPQAKTQGAPADHAPPAPAPGPHPGITCTVGFCPVCLLVTAAGSASPELAEHLAAAGRELLLALRALIDARLEATGPETRPNGLERIHIE
jgi:hypothetical protein